MADVELQKQLPLQKQKIKGEVLTKDEVVLWKLWKRRSKKKPDAEKIKEEIDAQH
ncbi:MAG: hypothetical protein IPH36_19645 [Saprospiraceae bacterium]|nr:hypothetical protein [Saprospiraceae bacterium]